MTIKKLIDKEAELQHLKAEIGKLKDSFWQTIFYDDYVLWPNVATHIAKYYQYDVYDARGRDGYRVLLSNNIAMLFDCVLQNLYLETEEGTYLEYKKNRKLFKEKALEHYGLRKEGDWMEEVPFSFVKDHIFYVTFKHIEAYEKCLLHKNKEKLLSLMESCDKEYWELIYKLLEL